VCITCFQNGAFAWAARDLAPGGNKLQGRTAPILAESPPFPPLRILAFGWLTLVFCSYIPIATPNQPKSPCDTLGSSTKSALCRFFSILHLIIINAPNSAPGILLLGLHAYGVELPHSTVIFCLGTRMQIWTRVRTSNRTLRQTSRHP
jgi:hypothetical protein